MHSKFARNTLRLTSLLLVMCTGLVIYGDFRVRRDWPRGTLLRETACSLEASGFARREIGDAASDRRAAADQLRYDFGWIGRSEEYSSAGDLLVLGWAPGTISYRWALRHTPDICWPSSGLMEVQSESCSPVSDDDFPYFFELRAFAKDGRRVNVLFMHFLNGCSVPIGNGMPEPLSEVGSRILGQWFAQRGDQIYIRVVDNTPISWAESSRNLKARARLVLERVRLER